MIGRRLMDDWRGAGAVLALLATLLFVMLSAPSHAEPPADLAAPAAAGAHCATHCAGHVAPPVLAVTEIDARTGPAGRHHPADDDAPATLSSAPPTRPPAA